MPLDPCRRRDDFMENDSRPNEYQDLIHQLVSDKPRARAAANKIFNILLEFLQPRSILDVGCGLGTWLAAARDLGITDGWGIEGPWIDLSQLDIPQSQISLCDLEHAFSLQRQFDLVLCLEVAEHLSQQAADSLVAALTSHGQTVLFSAAIPYQGGHHHVNEQFLDYWAKLFLARDFAALDIFRPRLWEDSEIPTYLRQNVVLFAHRSVIDSHAPMRNELSIRRPLSIVHPDLYSRVASSSIRYSREHVSLLKFISRGGIFSAKICDEGLKVKRLGPDSADDALANPAPDR